MPGALRSAGEQAHEAVVEMVAEGNDKLMEEFFEKGTIPPEDLGPVLRQAVSDQRVIPMLAASGLANVGSENLLNFIVDFLPSPAERGEAEGFASERGEPVKRK